MRFHSSKGVRQDKKPKIFWDSSNHCYMVSTPNSKEFKLDLKNTCFSATWCGKEAATWSIDADELDRAKVVVEAHYGEFDFIGKPDEVRRAVNGNAGAEAALTMFEIGGYDEARRIYSMLIRQYHPDKNPDPGATAKAAAITTAWKKLKQELGWS